MDTDASDKFNSREVVRDVLHERNGGNDGGDRNRSSGRNRDRDISSDRSVAMTVSHFCSLMLTNSSLATASTSRTCTTAMRTVSFVWVSGFITKCVSDQSSQTCERRLVGTSVLQ